MTLVLLSRRLIEDEAALVLGWTSHLDSYCVAASTTLLQVNLLCALEQFNLHDFLYRILQLVELMLHPSVTHHYAPQRHLQAVLYACSIFDM